jgi:hypothetical protein
MVDCDSGTSAAPKAPCSSRKTTICSSDCAAPQSTDARVKPPTDSRKTARRPKRATRKPTGAVRMAAAVM